MSLPPWAPWWIGVLGALFATTLGKGVFGGLGCNLFNPAMVARVFLLISFPVQMTVWVAPLPITAATAPNLHDSLRILLQGIPELDAVAPYLVMLLVLLIRPYGLFGSATTRKI